MLSYNTVGIVRGQTIVMYRGDFFPIQISKAAVRCPYAGMFVVMYSDIVPVRLEEDGIKERKRKEMPIE
jgi:hypothetical protein